MPRTKASRAVNNSTYREFTSEDNEDFPRRREVSEVSEEALATLEIAINYPQEEPPTWKPRSDDEYKKPELRQFVRVDWHDNVPRTGLVYKIFSTNSVMVHFYYGYHTDNLHYWSDWQVRVTRARFDSGDFRAYPELRPGCVCYDREKKGYALVTAIHNK